jgi:hypothetical protein
MVGVMTDRDHLRRGTSERIATFAEELRLWVFTEHAAGFYERCGWERAGTAVEHGEPGDVLTRRLAP